MKIVFLDFDGVLNSRESMDAAKARGERRLSGIHAEHVAVLNDLLAKSGAMVVVSSMWRVGSTIGALKDVLHAAGFTGKVLGTTPILSGVRGQYVERGHEIQKWLEETHHDVESFVILDDDTDMAHLEPRLVWVDWDRGLRPEHVEKALAMLGCVAPSDPLYPRAPAPRLESER